MLVWSFNVQFCNFALSLTHRATAMGSSSWRWAPQPLRSMSPGLLAKTTPLTDLSLPSFFIQGSYQTPGCGDPASADSAPTGFWEAVPSPCGLQSKRRPVFVGERKKYGRQDAYLSCNFGQAIDPLRA